MPVRTARLDRSRACRSWSRRSSPSPGARSRRDRSWRRAIVAEVTHPVVTRVLEAGAVVHGRTTTPEFSCAPFTHSTLWGVTRNPWDLATVPGWLVGWIRGSPGGGRDPAGDRAPTSAARSGSLPRCAASSASSRPSAACRACRRSTPTPTAPTGRSVVRVADVARLQNVLAGPHPGDQASLRPAYVLPGAGRGRARDAGGAVHHLGRLRGRPGGRGEHAAGGCGRSGRGGCRRRGGHPAVDP